MNSIRKRRLYLVLLIVFGVGIAASLILFALRQNINLFYTPTQVIQGEAPHNHVFRIGGLVEKGSVKRQRGSLEVSFVLTDLAHDVTVDYTGILPDLFREGQAIVAQGKLGNKGEFVADQVLAKHDSTYMPPEVKDALQKGRKMRLSTHMQQLSQGQKAPQAQNGRRMQVVQEQRQQTAPNKETNL